MISPQTETSTPGGGEEKTPGRLQAVWPPLKEEKVGLKYTEAGTDLCKNITVLRGFFCFVFQCLIKQGDQQLS